MFLKAALLILAHLLACHGKSVPGNEEENSEGPGIGFKEFFGFNMGDYVINVWERQQQNLIGLSQHEKFSALIQEMVDINPCVNSLEAHIKFLEQGVEFVEEAAPLIEEVIMTTYSLG